jgi:hypothetical protein
MLYFINKYFFFVFKKENHQKKIFFTTYIDSYIINAINTNILKEILLKRKLNRIIKLKILTIYKIISEPIYKNK